MTQTEPTDRRLAELQDQLDAARAQLAAERARRTAKAGATRTAKAARVPFRKGDRVRITAPRSPRYHGQETTVTAVNSDVAPGEVQALGAWFALTEVTRLPRAR